MSIKKIIVFCLVATTFFVIGYNVPRDNVSSSFFQMKNPLDEKLNTNNKLNQTSISVCSLLVQKLQNNPVEIYSGDIAEVNFSQIPESTSYSTLIKSDVLRGPNFAGHYRYVHWGCGSGCRGYALVDLISGEVVYYVPGNIIADPIYEVKSNILVLFPFVNIDDFEDKTIDEIVESEPYGVGLTRDYFRVIEDENGKFMELEKLCSENVTSGIISY